MCAACKRTSTPPPPPPTGFTFADLGPGKCTSINSAGQAVGADDSGAAFIVTASAHTPLPALPDGSAFVALSINDQGQVAGYSQGDTRQAIVLLHGSWQTVPFLAGGKWSIGSALDSSGSVVGVGTVADTGSGDLPAQHAFRSQGGAPTDLGTLGGNNSAASATSQDGSAIAGRLETASGATHAFVWSGGKLTDLGTLGGTNSAAYGVNRNGEVVGVAEGANGQGQAFLYTKTLAALPNLGGQRSDARAINDSGLIAGNALDPQGKSHPVAWQNNTLIDLMPKDDAGTPWTSATAEGVSRKNAIIGWGVQTPAASGAMHCLVWTPK